MSLFNRQNTTLAPAPGVAPRTAADVRAALLALNTPDARYVIRDGTPEGVDLVAEFQLVKLTRKGVFGRVQECEDFQIRLRLVPEAAEVHTMDFHSEFTLTGEDPPRKRTTSHARGQIHQKFVGYDLARTPAGPHEKRESYRFDTDDLKHTLQQTVLTAGWTWHGLRRGKL
ncbi:hypothetical protein [Actinacidiphila paucisporea]|uniref:Uncharacterized protein n=1 Tax=Actinacidiphila paucisporea TaxID=310782 RepID=A0A1M6U2P8_9ACTN|nr:hypothetical protein [Actinacidiphila paucisporea]SHK63431.1 hypothetical protein SAMN05216499_101223 [Actinacidiphila paucisporea]